jgi:hypothetical protein
MVRHFLRLVGIRLFRLFLELITSTSTGARANRPANDRTRRSGDGTADGSAAYSACRPAGAGACSLIAFGCLARDGSAGRTDWAAHHAAHDSPTDCTAGTADGLAGMLLVVGRGALARGNVPRVGIWVDRISVSSRVVHGLASSLWALSG